MAANPSSPFQVLIVSQYGFLPERRNQNAYQRILYGARYADVVLLVRCGQPVAPELSERVQVHHAPVWNRGLFFVYAVLFAIWTRLRGTRCIFTEPSGFAAVGFLAKYLAGYFWVMDVWDPPRRHSCGDGTNYQRSFADRFVFWLMGFADLYLLSVLPQAANAIRMPENKRLQLYNAIDLSCVARKPPRRDPSQPLLRVAYTRSRFGPAMGLDTVVAAAEILAQRNCPVEFNLIGHIGEEDRARITKSRASGLFRLHGFIATELTAVYRDMHVGVVPFKACDDLSYVFPIKVLEHFSQGNPVIASRLPGLCEMVKHECNGLIVEAGDAEALANAIERLQKDNELYDRLAWGALESVQQFDVETKHQRIFETILSRLSHSRSSIVPRLHKPN